MIRRSFTSTRAAPDPDLQQAPWLVIYPGVAIMATIFGLNLFGDALRDLLDPKVRALGGDRPS